MNPDSWFNMPFSQIMMLFVRQIPTIDAWTFMETHVETNDTVDQPFHNGPHF